VGKKEHGHIQNNFSNSEPIFIICSQFCSEMDQLTVMKFCPLRVIKTVFTYVGNQKIIDKAVAEWRLRLTASVNARPFQV